MVPVIVDNVAAGVSREELLRSYPALHELDMTPPFGTPPSSPASASPRSRPTPDGSRVPWPAPLPALDHFDVGSAWA